MVGLLTITLLLLEDVKAVLEDVSFEWLDGAVDVFWSLGSIDACLATGALAGITGLGFGLGFGTLDRASMKESDSWNSS